MTTKSEKDRICELIGYICAANISHIKAKTPAERREMLAERKAAAEKELKAILEKPCLT